MKLTISRQVRVITRRFATNQVKVLPYQSTRVPLLLQSSAAVPPSSREVPSSVRRTTSPFRYSRLLNTPYNVEGLVLPHAPADKETVDFRQQVQLKAESEDKTCRPSGYFPLNAVRFLYIVNSSRCQCQLKLNPDYIDDGLHAIGRRRHSWCCSSGPFSACGKRYVTQSTQTIEEAQITLQNKNND